MVKQGNLFFQILTQVRLQVKQKHLFLLQQKLLPQLKIRIEMTQKTKIMAVILKKTYLVLELREKF